MQALRIVMLLMALALGYLMFFRSQPNLGDPSLDSAPSGRPTTAVEADSRPHSQYKEAMNRANAAAKQMQTQRAEADSY